MNAIVIGSNKLLLNSLSEYVFQLKDVCLIGSYIDPVDVIDFFLSDKKIDIIFVVLENYTVSELKIMDKLSRFATVILLQIEGVDAPHSIPEKFVKLSWPMDSQEFSESVKDLRGFSGKEAHNEL